MPRHPRIGIVLLGLALLAGGCRTVPPAARIGPVVPAPSLDELSEETRLGYIRRAQVWSPIDTAALDLLAGPAGPGSFAFDARVECDYVDKGPLSGATPKFICRAGKEDYKVKYGDKNGEVFAEVAASRLLWALGFGSDAVYPVQVLCRGCPMEPWLWKNSPRTKEQEHRYATIERKLEAVTLATKKVSGWRWRELDLVEPVEGGAPLEHREALKLLAVFLQHGDNKSQQQRLVCFPDAVRKDVRGESCERPFLVVSDVGGTFGRSGTMSGEGAKLRFRAWSTAPVFRNPTGCVGELDAMMGGDLQNPGIREAGRRFLAERLALLSDAQIRNLFVAARAEARGETIEKDGVERPVTVDDWVEAFKTKRQQIADRRCPS